MDPMEVLMQSFGQSIQVAQALRSAAEQQQRFDQEMQLRRMDQQMQRDRDQRATAHEGRVAAHQSLADQLAILSGGGRAISSEGTVQMNTDVPRYRADAGGGLERTGSGINLAADLNRAVEAGGQRFYMPTPEENASLSTRLKLAETNAVNEANALPDTLTGALEKQLGFPAGSMRGTPKTAISGVLSQFAKPEKPDNLELNWAPDGTEVTFNRGTGEKRYGRRYPRPDAQLTPGQSGVQSRFDAKEAKNAIDRKHEALAKAEAAFAKDLKDAGDMPERAQAAKDRLWNAKQQAQNQYEEAMSALGVTLPHVDYGTQRQQMTAGQQQPTQQGKKTATLTQVRAYAKQKGIPEAQGIREFQQSGYIIGQ